MHHKREMRSYERNSSENLPPQASSELLLLIGHNAREASGHNTYIIAIASLNELKRLMCYYAKHNAISVCRVS